MRHTTTVTALALATSIATAAPASDSDTPAWAGSVDAGYTAIAGNSQSRTLVAAARAEQTRGRMTHHLEARARNTEETGVRSAEAYAVTGKEDIAFSPRDYLFVHAAWEKDRFAGYDWQLAVAAGYGRKLIDDERQKLSVETGPGLRHDDLPAGDTEDQAVARAALDYRLKVTGNTRYTQRLEADAGEDGTLSRSLSELAVAINSHLALKASLEFRRDSAPPAGTRNTDRTTVLALAWTF